MKSQTLITIMFLFLCSCTGKIEKIHTIERIDTMPHQFYKGELNQGGSSAGYQTDRRPLSGLNPAQKSFTLRVEPGSPSGVMSPTTQEAVVYSRLAQFIRTDGSPVEGEALTITLGLALAAQIPGDAPPIDNDEPIFVTARISWVIGNVTYVAFLDFQNNTTFSVRAENVTVDFGNQVVAPGVGTIPALTLTASIAYATSQYDNDARLTRDVGTILAAGTSTPQKIPPFATSVTLTSRNPNRDLTISFLMINSNARPPISSENVSGTSPATAIAIDIPNGARYYEVTNNGAVGEADVNAIFAIGN